MSLFADFLKILGNALKLFPKSDKEDGGDYQDWDAIRAELASRLNVYRKLSGRKELARDLRLDLVAQRRADWMASRGELTRFGPGRKEAHWLVRDIEPSLINVTEHIYCGDADPDQALGNWLAQYQSRETFLDEWHGFGVGFRSKGGSAYWSVLFARKETPHA